ncbi:MAG TPA: sigma-E factor regulatory protein RseB domain-containing protein [bacterium]|nr:sigma-E factor regulatory protein RseB domain-containing protein [bacterium]
MIPRLILGAALLAVLAVPGRAQLAERPLPTPARILATMLAAPALIDYEGTKVISTVRGERAETVTILEASKRLGGLRLEFLSPESVSGRLIVDDGVTAWQYEPALHLVVRGPSFVQGAARAERAAEIASRYRARVLGREAVIGRTTVVLDLVPADEGVRRLWIDEASGVVLRTEERDARGEILYVSYFSRISYSLNLPLALFRFRPPAGAKRVDFFLSGPAARSLEALRAQTGGSRMLRPRLLDRFAFREGRRVQHGAFSAVAATYTDGASVVTVFQTPTARMAFPAVGRLVSTAAGPARFLDVGYFRLLVWQAGEVTLAVIGNVPPAVLMRIAEALRTNP